MLENLSTIIIILIVLVVIVWSAIRLLSRSYIKTTAATAFVRTGGLRGARSEPLVVMNGAAWVFAFMHRIKWVSLETMAIEIRNMEEDALVTIDPQYVDLEARFFIKVGNNPQSVGIAARTIGGDVVDESRVRRLVEPKIHGAVRDVAAGFTLRQLLEKRMDFVKAVQDRLRDDLSENGLILESVSILTLRPTLQGHFSTDDILGAQVARANAAVIEQALTEKNKLEKLGSLERAQQDAEAELKRLEIEEHIEKERAERAKNIALVRASEDAAARIIQEAKRKEAEEARILADRALQEATIENERIAAVLREQSAQAVEVERVTRERAIAIAEEERQARIAEAAASKLQAAQKQIEADKEREQALQAAMTVVEKAAAEREAEIELINVRLEAEKQAIERKSEVELETLRLKEMAEAEREVAAVRAKITRIQAEAELEAAKMEALGERERSSAAGLAEVQVALERVKVLEREAEAIRQKLVAEAEGEKARSEALASQEGIGRELELARLNADVLKAVEIARAQALGEALANMKMSLYGDASMARQVLQMVTLGQSAEQVYDALPGAAQNALKGLARRIGALENGAPSSDLHGLFDTLFALAKLHHPDLLDENPTLGELADDLLDAEGIPKAARDQLSVLATQPELRDLPLQTALVLARQWLGWKGVV